RSDAPQGVCATVRALQPTRLDRLVEAERPFLVVLDGVHDPQNLGAILRTAEAAGATGVVLPRHRAVPPPPPAPARAPPAVTRAARGAVEWLPIAVVPGIPAALADLRAKGVWVV